MGLFSQVPEFRKDDWAGIPSDPLREKSTAESLDEAPAVDPFALTLPGSTSSIVFPVAAPAPEAADASTGEPEHPEDNDDQDADDESES